MGRGGKNGNGGVGDLPQEVGPPVQSGSAEFFHVTLTTTVIPVAIVHWPEWSMVENPAREGVPPTPVHVYI